MLKPVAFELPLPPSEANLREHPMARARRVERERRDAYLLTRAYTTHTHHTAIALGGGRVEILRRGSRRLDGDNLAASAKHVRDGIADGLQIDDGNPRVEWVYSQALVGPRERGLVITITPRDTGGEA